MIFVIILSVVFGGVLMLVLQATWLYWYFKHQPKQPVPRKHLYDRVEQRNELSNPSTILNTKESCHAANALISFLFNELKDTIPVRRWIIKKMNVELNELLHAKTAGKILEQITVRDYCLGPTFPVLSGVTLKTFTTVEGTSMPETVDVAVDLDYGGGFRVSVDVDLVFGTSAYVSVIVSRLKGRARLEFTRDPYTHWSFSFYDEPELEFDIETHFEGRTVHQLGSLIVNQLRKTLRKKHTLPAYKIRHKPFFPKPEPVDESDLRVCDSKISTGRLQVTVVECSRLPLSEETLNSELYVTLCLDSHAWTHEDIEQRFHGDCLVIEVQKGTTKNVGITFSRGVYNKEVVVASISPESPARVTDLRKGDVVLEIDGVKMTSARQAAKIVKQAKERFEMQVQRPINLLESLPVTSAAYDQPDLRTEEDMSLENDYDDFINVRIMTELGLKDDDEADTVSVNRLQVPSVDSPVVQRRNKQPTTSDGRRLSSCLDYETVKELSTQQDNDDRLQKMKRIIKDTIHPAPRTEKPKEDAMAAVPLQTEAMRIPGVDLDAISVSSFTSQLEDIDGPSSSSSSPPLGPPVAPPVGSPVGPTVGPPAGPPVGPPAGPPTGPPTGLTTDPSPGLEDIQETCLMPATPNPEWDEAFNFSVGEMDTHLNVCVWNRLGMAVGERDVLIGYASIKLMDVALQCVSTLSGEHLELFKLQPPEQRGGATRLPSQMHLYAHPGFDSNLGYGDISLFFLHSPFEEAPKPSCKEGSQDRPELSPYDGRPKPSVVTEDRGKAGAAKKVLQRPDELNTQSPTSEPQPHKLVGTQFSSPTRCEFCGKKVWTKYGFQCQLCKLICHKKCSDKTQAGIPCDRTQISRRVDQPSPSKEASQLKQLETVSQSLAGGTSGRRTTPHPSPHPSPTPSPHESEEEEDEEEEDVEAMVSRLSKLKRQLRQFNTAEGNRVDDTDAMVMTAVREMGRELFVDLPSEERKEKLEFMIGKLQTEIDAEADRQLRLAKEVQQSRRRKQKLALEGALSQSEERMQTLANLMLHYCAGIQHCNETA